MVAGRASEVVDFGALILVWMALGVPWKWKKFRGAPGFVDRVLDVLRILRAGHLRTEGRMVVLLDPQCAQGRRGPHGGFPGRPGKDLSLIHI